MSQRYRKLPSELLHLTEEYDAYCLDEACAYIMQKLDEGAEPTFVVQYTSFEALYRQYQ